jgi:hypothetical protein
MKTLRLEPNDSRIDGRKRFWKPQKGYVIVYFLFFLMALLGTAAFTVDLGKTYDLKTGTQFATDAGAMAAAMLLGQKSDSEVRKEALSIAVNNNVGAADAAVGVQCGVWAKPDFTACSSAAGAPCTNCQSASANAVRMTAQRLVATSFAGVVGVKQIPVALESVALKAVMTPPNCARPIAVDEDGINDVSCPGGTTIFGKSGSLKKADGTVHPGNWHKLDLPLSVDPPHSYTDFEWGMLNGACDPSIKKDADFNSLPGGADMNNNENKIMSEIQGQEFIIPVVRTFMDVNGRKSITITGFIKVKYLGTVVSKGKGAGQWEGQFQLMLPCQDVTPTTEPTVSVPPVLVK